MELLILLLQLLNSGYRSPASSPVPQARNVEIVQVDELSEYVYPGAEIIEQGTNHKSLKSSDDVDDITDWYISMISNTGFRNINKSKVNGEVRNLIVNDDYEVLIKKSPDDDFTFIEVTLK